MSPKQRQFAAFVTKHRKQRGLSMAALAEEVGVTKSNVHYWESGEGVPKASVLEPLAQALGVSYEDLFALAGYSHPEGLPEPTPYLRAKYPDAPKKAIKEAEQFFSDWQERHGGGDADESDR
jgi:transcriptional regulator with XRE-family HTH domain